MSGVLVEQPARSPGAFSWETLPPLLDMVKAIGLRDALDLAKYARNNGLCGDEVQAILDHVTSVNRVPYHRD